MRTQLLNWWQSLQSSYWFIPTLLAIFAIILSIVMINVDEFIEQESLTDFAWLYISDADGERAVLSTIAGSMITVAGVVFSITMVALSLASQQFGPRLLGNFMRDRTNQVVLGIFIATFIYCLLILRSISGLEENQFVPQLSVLVGVILALISIAMLIYFIHHISDSIRVSNIILETSQDLVNSIERLFPERIGDETDEQREQRIQDSIPQDFLGNARPIHAPTTDYLQVIEANNLINHAIDHNLLIRIAVHPGMFVIHGDVIAQVWHKQVVDDDLVEAIQNDFVFGDERTPVQDIAFLFNKLVEIAVRALSPGVNDPFTAMTCIDRLTEALIKITSTNIPSPYRFDEKDVLRVIASPIPLDELIHQVITPIRTYGASDQAVMQRLLKLVDAVSARTEQPEAQQALQRQADLIKRSASETLIDPWDAEQIKEEYQRIRSERGWADS